VTLSAYLIKWTFDFINFLHKPFKKVIPIQVFRYIFSGGLNTFLDSFIYFILYNYVIRKRDVDLSFFKISPHIASFLIVFPITFFTGFFLSKYITFTESKLQGRVQLLRFGITIVSSLVLQYLLMKLFVDLLSFYPTPSKVTASGIAAIYTYITHKHFSFKTKNILDRTNVN